MRRLEDIKMGSRMKNEGKDGREGKEKREIKAEEQRRRWEKVRVSNW